MKKVRLNELILPIFLVVISAFLASCLGNNAEVDNTDSIILEEQIVEFENYFTTNDIDAIEIGDGFYQVVLEEGTGEKIEGDEIIELKYAIRKFDTNQVIFFDSSYVLIPDKGFYIPKIAGKVTSLNYANTLLKENGVSDFYLASAHMFGQASGTINDVVINANQMIFAQYEVVDIRTAEEQRVFEDSILADVLEELELIAEPSLTGLYTIVLEEGTGEDSVVATSKINIDYKGTIMNGTEFDSGDGVNLTLSTLINGWKEGLLSQKAGAKLILFIPSHLAYGADGVINQGVVEIPSFEPLKFEITLNSID